MVTTLNANPFTGWLFLSLLDTPTKAPFTQKCRRIGEKASPSLRHLCYDVQELLDSVGSGQS